MKASTLAREHCAHRLDCHLGISSLDRPIRKRVSSRTVSGDIIIGVLPNLSSAWKFPSYGDFGAPFMSIESDVEAWKLVFTALYSPERLCSETVAGEVSSTAKADSEHLTVFAICSRCSPNKDHLLCRQ